MDLFDNPYKYVIDTSAFIDLKNNYPPSVFKNTVWRDFEKNFKDKTIVSVREVYLELKKGSDFLSTWIDNYKDSFLYPDNVECEIVRSLQDEYEFFVEIEKNGPHADPWIVACAQRYSVIIIQHEQLKNNKQKLPFVAKEKGIKYIKLPELFEIEKFKY